MRSSLSAAALLAALTTPLLAQDSAEHADHAAQGGGAVPAGWTLRADKGKAKNAKVVSMGSGLHLTLGPAIILYRADTRGSGPFHTLATFTQTKPSEHAEGYGLFVGGQELDGAARKYLYFLIRQDGSYLIKRRDGEKTSDVSKGWVQHPAVKQADAKGSATNLLEVDNKRDPSKLVFLVNGQEVYGTDAKGMALDGIVGIRANHNLDLHVEGFDVHR
jgi:opacity protein-like surface antigen